MTIARGQMNRQLYADGGVQTLTDMLEPSTREMVEELMDNMRFVTPPPSRRSRKKMRDEDEEIMIRLQELQKRPEYQYDETRPYEGPRDMRMGGGIMTIRPQYGFGSFVSDIVGGVGDAIGGIGDFAGDVLSEGVKILDPLAQVASFVPGPHQPFARAYSGVRGVQQGNPGQVFAAVAPSFKSPFNVGSATPGINPNLQGISLATGDGAAMEQVYNQAAKKAVQQQLVDQGTKKSTANILGKVLQGGLSLFGAKKSYDDQKRINEQRQKEYDRFIERQEEKRRQYQTGEGLASLEVTNRRAQAEGGSTKMGYKEYKENEEFMKDARKKYDAYPFKKTISFDDFVKDILKKRTGMAAGGIMDLDVRTNPQGTKEIDYREKGGFVPPIGIKEKADDIPAMLSNNEFVFTADAVRGAGNGDVNKGAKKMYALMAELEEGGKV